MNKKIDNSQRALVGRKFSSLRIDSNKCRNTSAAISGGITTATMEE
jgi:hypothetical protein